ncbi:MAG TPA: DUF2157 domain-containing protein [Longimicrobiales bacterium]|nr:DUF2157 domain-containing protein [Longimicrobiales bacterium]
MSSAHTAVEEALRRWQAKGLIDPILAARLLGEAEESETVRGRLQGQLVVAGVGAVLLLIASLIFFVWAWPELGEASRSTLLLATGVLAQVGAAWGLRRERWRPVGYGLEVVALCLLLSAFLYSSLAWPDGSAGGVVMGLLALLTPAAIFLLGLREDPVLSALGTAFGFAFLYAALERATPLSTTAIVWILDGVLLALLVTMAARLVPEPGRASPGEGAALVTALFGGLVLVLITSLGPLNLERWAPLPVDAWLVLVTLAVLAALRAEAAPVPRAWLERLLFWCLVLAIPMAFWTLDGALRAHYAVTALGVAAVGGFGMLLALRGGLQSALPAGALALVVAAWYLGMKAGGALPVAAALAFTAGVFFWTSARMGRSWLGHTGGGR